MIARRYTVLIALVLALGFLGFGCQVEPSSPSEVKLKNSTWRSSFGWTITFNDDRTWINSSGVSGTWNQSGSTLKYTVTSTGKDHTTGVTWTGHIIDNYLIMVDGQGATPSFQLNRI